MADQAALEETLAKMLGPMLQSQQQIQEMIKSQQDELKRTNMKQDKHFNAILEMNQALQGDMVQLRKDSIAMEARVDEKINTMME